MIVELISVGTELLLGDIVNTDARYLAELCARLGFNLYFQSVVGDNHDRLMSALSIAAERSDIQILTGGLGSTDDDITKTVCMEFVDKPAEENELAKERIFSYFSDDLARERNRKVYTFPKGSEILENKVGTAEGAIIPYLYKGQEKIIIILPGPPNEMIPMAEESLSMKLASFIDSTTISQQIKIGILGEYQVNELLKEEIQTWKNPSIAPYVKEDGAMLRITAKASNKEEAIKLIDRGRKRVFDKLSSYIVAEGRQTRPEALIKILKEKKETIATAESITGGLIASTIIDAPGASDSLKESYIVYSDMAKEKILKVPSNIIDKETAVSYQVCEKMLEGLEEISKADLLIATTGYAGPTGPEIGHSFIGVSYKGKKDIEEFNFKGDRAMIRRRARNIAIDKAILVLKDSEK